MASFNRVVTTLLLLILIPIVTIALIVPRDAIDLLVDALDGVRDQVDPSPSALEMLIRVALVIVIDVVLVLLVYLQLRRRSKFGVPVSRIAGSDAQIAVDSIVERLTYKVDQLPGVLAVTPKITPHRRDVEVALEIETVADAGLHGNLEEVTTVTRQVIEEELGLKLRGNPQLHLRTVTYPDALTTAEGAPRAPAAPQEAEAELEPLELGVEGAEPAVSEDESGNDAPAD